MRLEKNCVQHLTYAKQIFFGYMQDLPLSSRLSGGFYFFNLTCVCGRFKNLNGHCILLNALVYYHNLCMLPYLTDQLVEEQTHAKSNQEEIIQTKSEFFVLLSFKSIIQFVLVILG